jgi:hypothetical protein
MSDALAASVPENGVPPFTHNDSPEEAPGFKVYIHFSFLHFTYLIPLSGLCRKSCVLYNG